MTEPYTPFFRRPTDDTNELFAWVARRQRPVKDRTIAIGRRVFPAYEHLSICDDFSYAMLELLYEELDYLEPPNCPTLEDYIHYRNRLNKQHYYLQHEERLTDTLVDALTAIFGGLAGRMPKLEEPSPFRIPLINAVSDPRQLVLDLMMEVGGWEKRGVLKACYEKLNENYNNTGKTPLLPTESKVPLEELAKTYLGGTPFEKLFHLQVPLALPMEKLFEHIHLLGGSGSGKTVTIERLIMWLRTLPEPPTIVLVDPHSDLIRKLSKAEWGFDPLIIDPRDAVKYPLAFNIFAPSSRLDDYDDITKEQVTAGAIETFLNLFQNLGIPLTGKQDVFFRACCRMLLMLPEVAGRNATIRDMLDLMRGGKAEKEGPATFPEPYQSAIQRLPALQRDFFEQDFMTKTFDATREQIRYRLQAIISEPTMERIFCSPETKIDFFEVLNEGGMVLIDGAKDFLKEEGSANFGRLMLSLILKAIMERAALPAEQRKPVILFIDEAASLFSRDISSMLEEVRKHKTGVLLAHQSLGQCDGKLLSSIHANTSTKLCSGASAADAATMAREMRTDTDLILNLPRLHFAAFIRNVTSSAVTVPMTPIGQLQQRLDFDEMMERNRERISIPKVEKPSKEAWTDRVMFTNDGKRVDVGDDAPVPKDEAGDAPKYTDEW